MADSRFYSVEDIRRIYGTEGQPMARSTVYEHEAKGLIPRGVRRGRRRVWLRAMVDRHISEGAPQLQSAAA